jgi:hypothetical protein
MSFHKCSILISKVTLHNNPGAKHGDSPTKEMLFTEIGEKEEIN